MARIRGESSKESHCHLAQFRDLMYGMKYGDMIGLKPHSLETQVELIQKREFYSQSQRRITSCTSTKFCQEYDTRLVRSIAVKYQIEARPS